MAFPSLKCDCVLRSREYLAQLSELGLKGGHTENQAFALDVVAALDKHPEYLQTLAGSLVKMQITGLLAGTLFSSSRV